MASTESKPFDLEAFRAELDAAKATAMANFEATFGTRDVKAVVTGLVANTNAGRIKWMGAR